MENTSGMDLPEFIGSTLWAIIGGVHQAAEFIASRGHPAGVHGAINPLLKDSTVDFDVAVTVSQSKEGGGGFKVAVFGAGVDAKGVVSDATQIVHRIKFSVPVTLASQPVGPEHIMASPPSPAPTGPAKERP